MAGLLMDSHVALWMIAAPEKLSVRAAAALANGAQPLHLSVITIWEMEMKTALGKLPLVRVTLRAAPPSGRPARLPHPRSRDAHDLPDDRRTRA